MDGKPRQLHIAESLKSIDFSLPVPQPQINVRCPYFDFRQENFAEPTEVVAPANSFLAVYEVASAQSTLLDPGEKMTVSGQVFLTKLPS